MIDKQWIDLIQEVDMESLRAKLERASEVMEMPTSEVIKAAINRYYYTEVATEAWSKMLADYYNTYGRGAKEDEA